MQSHPPFSPSDPAVREAFAAIGATLARTDRLITTLKLLPVMGRVPSQDVFADAPGYAPGLSKAVRS